MRVALKNGGVNCPAFSLIHDIEETKKALESIGLPVIVKPCDRSGSMGDTKVEQME